MLKVWLTVLMLGAVAAAPHAAADVKMSHVRLADSGEGLLYEPAEPGPKARVALVNIHSFSSYLNHTSCRNLAERGYRILCGNTRFTNAQDGYKGFEDHAPAIRSAVARAKAIPGVTKVVLIGHSMGAPMMAFYQNIAQNGAKSCQGPEKIMPCEDRNLRDLSSPASTSTTTPRCVLPSTRVVLLMLCVDVNVLVYAHRGETPRHDDYLSWLSSLRNGPELVGVPGVTVAGFLRLVTNPRVFRDPTPLEQALSFARALLDSPSVTRMAEGARHSELSSVCVLGPGPPATASRMPTSRAWRSNTRPPC